MHTKILSSLITIMVIIGLVIAGNASALEVDIKPENDRATAREVINFHITIERQGESINSLMFKLDGPVDRNCEFDIDGNPIADCQGITIKRLTEDFGYGYGLQRFLKYKITLDSSSFEPGDYNVSMIVNDDVSDETTITIKDKKKGDDDDENEHRNDKDNKKGKGKP